MNQSSSRTKGMLSVWTLGAIGLGICAALAAGFAGWGSAQTGSQESPAPGAPVGLTGQQAVAAGARNRTIDNNRNSGQESREPSGDARVATRKESASSDEDKRLVVNAAEEKSKAGDAKESPAKEGPAKEGPAKEEELEHPFPRRSKAPGLDGGKDWLNCAGPIEIKQLRGKWVLLDFWTYCCINCMHILPELKKLEKAHPNDLVVIGVHSAKFDTEKGTQNIRDAILRYEIEHPVVNDADHVIWENFGVSSWPSLRLIDPEGNVVAQHSGEIGFEDLDGFLKKASPYYTKKGAFDPTPLEFKQETAPLTPLRFPGKVLADEASGRLFIADSNHNRIVVTKLDGTLIDTIGRGDVGRTDGDFRAAQFNHPQGMALRGDTLYVADTESHLLRKIDLAGKRVTTIAGTGSQRRSSLWPGIKIDDDGVPTLPKRFVGKPGEEMLASPWDLWIHGSDLFVAMAGPHQIWKMTLDEKEIGPYAGNGREDIVDGPLLPGRPFEADYSSFAQPSGLSSDGEVLFVADSEGSSIRTVPLNPKAEVRTLLGTSHLRVGRLFAFGDVDGALDKAQLQHCLGVAYHDGKLYVADTYNDKVKEIDIKGGVIKTIAGKSPPKVTDGKAAPAKDAAPAKHDPLTLDEPAGISVAGGKLYVADTNHHLIRVIDLKNGNKLETLVIAQLSPPTPPAAAAQGKKPKFPGAKQVELAKVTAKSVDGKVTLSVDLTLPDGWKMNPDAPMLYYIEADGETGPVDRSAIGKAVKPKDRVEKFDIPLPIKAATGSEKLKVSLTYYYCEKKEGGVCKIGSVIWTVPVELSADAKSTAVPLPYKIEEVKLPD